MNQSPTSPRTYISIDLGTVNFGLCHVTVTENNAGAESKLQFTVHEWKLLQICSSELNETETVRMMIEAFFKMFPDLNHPPKVDYILIEQQHRINRNTDHAGHALLAMFAFLYRDQPTQVHMPNGSLKIHWSVEQFGHTEKLPQRSSYAQNHSYNKAVAREATRMVLADSSLTSISAIFEASSKKDDLADSLLQALAFDRFVVLPTIPHGGVPDPTFLTIEKSNMQIEASQIVNWTRKKNARKMEREKQH